VYVPAAGVKVGIAQVSVVEASSQTISIDVMDVELAVPFKAM